MIFFLLSLLSFSAGAQAPEEKTAPAAEAVPAAPSDAETVAPTGKDSSDYEVDYEEEPSADDDEEPVEVKPAKTRQKKTKTPKNAKESASQGSIASKKFAPLMKSETKSIYKKNGKPLDVDSD